MKQGILNRKKYEQIRKFDHTQMQEYFRGVFASGYEAGVKAASEKREVPELVGLEDELLSIRGIGSAKARSICDQVRDFLERKAKDDEAGTEISGE